MTSISRDQAIGEIVAYLLAHLSPADRESQLLDWWSVDSDDAEYSRLPEYLRNEISSSIDSPANPTDPRYDPLLRMALEAQFFGVLNTYLEKRLSALGSVVEVVGELEPLEQCPCCGFHSLPHRSEYDVCSVCFWEDDGTTEPESRSSPNHMTLGEARENFARVGAVAEAFVGNVVSDGKDRFPRGKL